LIKEIVAIFDQSVEVDASKKKIIFEKMQRIQELGMPPEEVAAKISVSFPFTR
jgi:hypothetical protein